MAALRALLLPQGFNQDAFDVFNDRPEPLGWRHRILTPVGVSIAGRLTPACSKGEMNQSPSLATRVSARLAETASAMRTFLARPRPLRTQLLILTLASALPITAFSGVLLWQLANREQSQYEERLRQTAHNLAADFDRQLVAMTAVLDTLATSVMLQREQFADFHAQAQQAILGQPLAVILVDPTGQQILNTRVEFGNQLPKIGDLETLPKVLATKTHQVSNLFLGNVSLKPTLNIHSPVMRNGEVRYDLVLAFDPQLIRDITTQQYLPQGWIVGVSDGNHRIITNSLSHERYVNALLPDELIKQRSEQRVVLTKRMDGVPVLRTVVPLKNADWAVAVTVEQSTVLATMRNASAALLLAGLVLISLVAAVATWLSRVLTQEIGRLASAAVTLDKGGPMTSQDGLVTELNDVRRSLAVAAARRQEHERERDLLMRELHHRVKNSFAVLQSILNATLRTTSDPAEFANNFKGRLHSMAAAQDILTARVWTSAELEPLAQGQLAAYIGGPNQRLVISGPKVELPPETAVPIGLILHELGTNATKYGALSVPSGRIELSWVVDAATAASGRKLRLVWRERGGPLVVAPARRGFGSTLIERGLPSAEVERRFEADGITCTIVLPLDARTEPAV
jgi:two-component sensor histidine kinase